MALWHERDISHSSVERVILPDSTILTDYLLDKTTRLVDSCWSIPSACAATSNDPRPGVFRTVLLDLAAAGMLRESPIAGTENHAMKAGRMNPTSERYRAIHKRW